MPDPIQRAIGAVLAIVTAPLVAVLALLVRLDSPGPALYRATRVGKSAEPFVCLKLRTMKVNRSGPDPAVTRGREPRVTRIGRVLRRTRLDELPQLWNVARGQMRLVGPRPEDPRFVDLDQPLHRDVFTAKPGITGLTQLVYHDEGRLLDDAPDAELAYRQNVLPAKLRIDAAYLRHRSTRLDLWILVRTPLTLLFGTPRLPDEVRRDLERDIPASTDATAAPRGH